MELLDVYQRYRFYDSTVDLLIAISRGKLLLLVSNSKLKPTAVLLAFVFPDLTLKLVTSSHMIVSVKTVKKKK